MRFCVLSEADKTVEVLPPSSSGVYSVNGPLKLPQNPVNGSTTYTLVQIGSHAFYNAKVTAITPESIPPTVETIDESAFSTNTKLTSVEFPETVKTLGRSAFDKNTALESVSLNCVESVGETAFQGCSALATLDLGTKIKTIGNDAFDGCVLLTSVKFPESLINLSGFPDYKFTELKLHEGLKSVAQLGVSDQTHIDIPESLTTIGKSAFSGWEGLTDINLKNVTEIGQYAFYGCTNLVNIDLSKIRVLGGSAFNGTKIKVACLPDITTIGTYCFQNVTTLTNLTLGPNVSAESNNIVQGCTGIKYIIKPANDSKNYTATKMATKATVVTYPEGTELTLENGVVFSADKTSLIFTTSNVTDNFTIPETVETIEEYSLVYFNGEELVIPENVTTLSSYAMYKNSSYSSVKKKLVIKANITEIPEEAFRSCNFSSIDLPESLTSIASYAFSSLSTLGSIRIPDNVTSIADYAFSGTSFSDYVILPPNIKTVGTNAFSSLSSKVYVPEGFEGYTFNTKCQVIRYPSGKPIDVEPTNGVAMTTDGTVLVNVPATVAGEYVVPSTVTEIYKDAFNGCNLITQLTIPESVTSIGENAFEGCSSLTKVTIEGGDNASTLAIASNAFSNVPVESVVIDRNTTGTPFAGSTTITNVTVGANVTTLTEGEFAGSDAIEKIEFKGATPPAGVSGAFTETASKNATVTVPAESMDEYRSELGDDFDNIKPDGALTETVGGLTYEVVFGGGANGEDIVKVTDANGASGNVTIPENVTINGKTYPVTVIAPEAFKDNTAITSITVPGSVKNIGEGTFKGCTQLTSVNISEGVTEIAANVFEGCDELNAIVLPSTITKVDEAAFAGSSVTKVVMPETIAQIVTLPATVKAITVPEGVVPVVENGYVYGTVDGVKTVLISVPTDVTEVEIPSTVTTIYKGAFEGCTELTQVTIPATVKEIGEGAFKGCSNLKEVVLEGNETAGTLNVGKDAFDGTNVETLYQNRNTEGEPFSGNENLKNVTIGGNVTELKKGEFEGSDNITDITFEGTEPPAVDPDTFDKTVTDNVTPKVPDESKDEYEKEIGENFKELEGVGAITATVDGITYKVEKDGSGNNVVTVTGGTDELKGNVVIPD